jgi:hypothetical protein
MITVIAAIMLALAGLVVAFVAWRSYYSYHVVIGSLVLGFGAAAVLFFGFGSEPSSKQPQAAKQSPEKAAVPIKSPTPAPPASQTVNRKAVSKQKQAKRKVRKRVHSVHHKARHTVRKHRKQHKVAVVRKPSVVHVRVAPAPKRAYHPAHRAAAIRTHSAPRVRKQYTPPPRVVTTPAPVVRHTAPSRPSAPPLRIGNARTVHKAPAPKQSAPLRIG